MFSAPGALEDVAPKSRSSGALHVARFMHHGVCGTTTSDTIHTLKLPDPKSKAKQW